MGIPPKLRFQQLPSRMRRSQRLGAEPWAFLQGPAAISPLGGIPKFKQVEHSLLYELYYIMLW